MQNIFFITTPDSKLSDQKEVIIKVIEDEIPRLREIFNFSEFFNITVHNMPYLTIKEQGCGGYTPSAEWMQLYVDVDSDLWGSEQLLLNLKNTLIHEFNHTVRWATASYGYSLLETFISEGIATAFEKEQTKINVDWGIYSENEVATFLKTAKDIGRERMRASGDHSQYLFGTEAIPKYFGYKFGTYIIDEFRKNNPEIQWGNLTKMNHKEILEKSKVVF